MRDRIPVIALSCAIAALLAACPRADSTTSAPQAAHEESAMTTTEPVPPPDTAKGKRAAGEESAPLQAWRGFGTEPFWDARVDGDTLVFTTPDNQPGTTMRGRRVPSLVGYVFVGTHEGREFNLGLTPGECSDGMSDNRYAYTATFSYGDLSYRGCGELAR